MRYEKYLSKRGYGETTLIYFERSGKITDILTYNFQIESWVKTDLNSKSKEMIRLLEICKKAVEEKLIDIQYDEQKCALRLPLGHKDFNRKEFYASEFDN